MRSAESAMGVSGFLISCATRCATSFHASWRWARSSSVVSSTTSTVPGLSVREVETRAGDGQMHGAAAEMEFDLSGGGAHAMAATDEAGKFVENFGRQQRIDLLAAKAGIFVLTHQRRKGAIGLQDCSGSSRA